MVVREAGHPAQILHVNVAQNAPDLQCVRGVPDVVEHAAEVRGVVCERQLVGAVVGGPHAELVGDAVAGEVAVFAVAEGAVVGGDAALGNELVDARVAAGVEVAADKKGDLSGGRVHRGWSRGRRSLWRGGPGIIVHFGMPERGFI